MAKSPCNSCGNNKGKRICLLCEGKIICPECCVARRNADCLHCEHYLAAKRMEIDRFRSTGKHSFTANMAFDDPINEILQRLEKTMDLQGAAKELEKYADPSSPHYCFAKGVLCLMRDEADEAILSFQESVNLFPYFVPAWVNLASALMKTAHLPEAYDACQVALNLSTPNNYYHKLAQATLDEMKEFIKQHTPFSLQEYLKRIRDFEKYYGLMAKAPQKAAEGFLDLLEKEPQHVQCHGNLGTCYALLGRKADAVRELNRALELDPAYNVARANLANIVQMQEGIPLTNHPGLEYVGMEFYRAKFKLSQPGTPSKKQAIRDLFAACGIPLGEAEPDTAN